MWIICVYNLCVCVCACVRACVCVCVCMLHISVCMLHICVCMLHICVSLFFVGDRPILGSSKVPIYAANPVSFLMFSLSVIYLRYSISFIHDIGSVLSYI